MATFEFNNAVYNFNTTNLNKIENQELKVALEPLANQSFTSQSQVFSQVQPLLTATQFTTFKQNEIKNFININSTLVLIAILLYVAAFAISLGPVMWTMLSEIFPGNVKGIAISIVGFFNSLVSYTVTQFFPWELSNLGPTITFAIYAVLAVISLLFVLKYVVETKGKSLEEVEELLIRQ
jgi:MFS family permease